ncbi:hypothetical protein [Kitasatospora indigofera]|uniref:hypothetical protein n=1 Tax=Kitasatospora indigofera TaxID=67307 RepID=UPI0033AD3564
MTLEVTPVYGWAAAGLGLARTAGLPLAVGEATATSLAHGGGPGRLRLWTAGGHAVAETTDGGRPADRPAGAGPPWPLPTAAAGSG